MTKRAKRGKEEAFARLESTETRFVAPDGDVVGFEFDLKKTSTPAVVRFFCRAVGCPGYDHKASEIAHPFGTCGAIVNGSDAQSVELEVSSLIEAPPLTEPGHELPDAVAAIAETGFDPRGLAAELLEHNAATSHDMPGLEEVELPPAKEAMSIAEITKLIGWKPPEASTMPIETEQKARVEGFLATDEPEPVAIPETAQHVEWQAPAAPDVPPAPPAGTILRRDDSIGDQPDFIEVLDDETPTSVLVYVYPNVHLGTSYLHRSYTPYDFVGLVAVEELPPWALKIRLPLRTLPPLKVKQPPAATPETAQNQPVEPLPGGQLEKAPVGSLWRRDYDGLESEFIEVLNTDVPQACMLYQQYHGKELRFNVSHWPEIFTKISRLESFPAWVERLRNDWLVGDTVEGRPVEQPVFARPPDEPMLAPEQPELEPTRPVSDEVLNASSVLYYPENSAFWTCGECLIEVIDSNPFPLFDDARHGSVQVVQYESSDGPIQFSSSGTRETKYISYTDFAPGKIEPAAFCPPPWVIQSIYDRKFTEVNKFVDRAIKELNEGNALDVAGAAEAAIEEATTPEPPPLPPFSASDGTTPHPLLSIAAVLHELANELDVKPLHVMRALETGLQTFGQLLTFREMVVTSPAIESLAKLISVSIASEGPFFKGLRAGFSQATSSIVDERINQFATTFSTRISEVERATRGGASPPTAEKPSDRALVAEIRELVKNDCRELVSKAFDGWELKHQSPANPEDWSEIARDLDKAESRIFRLEGELKRVLDELKDYNRSVKLQKDDPQDSSKRGKAFREREKQKAREKAANLAALRKQKQTADALERGKERKKKAPKKAPKSKWKQTTIQGSGLDDVPPRGSRPQPKKAAKGGGTVFATNLKAIDKFMGKAKDDDVRSLLGRLPPSQLPKFLAAATKGSIAVEITHWNGSELGAFAKWFYATTNKR